MSDLSIPDIIRVLNAHGVRYVIIGGVAALVHCLPLPRTLDLDITPAQTDEDLERLAQAFDDLEAHLLTAEPGGTWFPRHPITNWRQYDTLHLVTKYGLVDIVFEPDGAPRGYDDLIDGASEHAVEEDDAMALVISVNDWERLKQAAGREKDLEHLDLFHYDDSHN